MQSPINFSALIITLALVSRLASGAGSEADEKAVWNLWQTHLSSSNNHETVVAAFQQAQKNASSNTLFTVARGLCAWHLLKMARTNEAGQLFAAMTSPSLASAVDASGSEMGRRWLTRLDREKVRAALGLYYRQHIAYPPALGSLKKMPSSSIPPPTDRWNVPWIYRLAGFKTIRGLADQNYFLQSARLKETSDLQTALERPYADAITIKPLAVVVTASGAENIRFESAGRKTGVILLAEGANLENVGLAYVGNKIIILTDGDYWLILPKPRQ